MPDDSAIGICPEPVIADCGIKAVSLGEQKGLPAQLPKELKSKFGTLCRCDYYLVAKEGKVLVLIEKTDLVKSIEKVQNEFDQGLKQVLRKTVELGMIEVLTGTESHKAFWNLVFNKIYEEHREKALATLYILEYMREHKVDSNLRSILDYDRVEYVLLLPNEIEDQFIKDRIISKIGDALQHSFISKRDFNDIGEKGFCQLMWKRGLHDAEFISFDTK